MEGMDKLISSTLSMKIKKEIDVDVLKKVEHELSSEYNMSIKLSIEHFQNFTNVIRKNSNIDTKKFEIDCINKIIKIKKTDNKYFVTIIDLDLSNLILELFGERETRKLLHFF